MTGPVVSFIDVLEGIEEVFAVLILIVLEDGVFPIAARSIVINSSGILYAKGIANAHRIAAAAVFLRPRIPSRLSFLS